MPASPISPVGRHPLAGLALGFAAVDGAFTVKMLIKPLDAVLVQFTNDAAHLVDPNRSIGLASNVWFSIASMLFLTIVIAFICDRMTEPRLGAYKPEQSGDGAVSEQSAELSEKESRGLRFALFALIGLIAVLPLLLWFFVVAVFIVPMMWQFWAAIWVELAGDVQTAIRLCK